VIERVLTKIMNENGTGTSMKASEYLGSFMKWFAIPVLAVLVFFMAKSKSLYEDLFSSWLDECRILILVNEPIIENENIDPAVYRVDTEIFTYGNTPDYIHLHFASGVPNIKNIKLLEPTEYKSLLEHRWSGKSCPPEEVNGFCQSSSVATNNLYKDIRVSLNPFTKHYQPTIQATLVSKEKIPATPNVYVKNLSDKPQEISCRVEKASWTNGWIWAPPHLRLVMLIIFFICIGTLVEGVRHYVKGEKA
jgi:hypothetical protein